MQIDTKLVHAGEPEPRIEGAVSIPIFQSAMYEHQPKAGYHDIRYIRLNNSPNHLALHAKLAALENAEAALVTGSGMAAISAALLTVLRQGDHLLAQTGLYGGSHTFIAEELPRFGIEFDFVSDDEPTAWKKLMRPTTRAVYVESISNPLFHVTDLEGLAEFAKENDLISLVDNTVASPVNYRPAEHGFDVSLHSGTKYLNGHSDIVAGAVIGRAPLLEKITHKLNHLGGSLDPHAAYLLHRGLKTLGIRVARQNESALEIARFLEEHAAVIQVNYPGLRGGREHERAKAWFDGYGGMLSFELKGGLAAAERFIQAVRLPIHAPSLGGVETLITRPATTSHSGMSPEERALAGVTDSLVRLSIGIEGVQDLLEDFGQALERN